MTRCVRVSTSVLINGDYIPIFAIGAFRDFYTSTADLIKQLEAFLFFSAEGESEKRFHFTDSKFLSSSVNFIFTKWKNIFI